MIPDGSEPTGNVFRTRSVDGEIIDTEPSSVFATQIALDVATSADGPTPTWIGCPTTASVCGLTRDTVPSPLLATRIDPFGATVTATGSRPTGICATEWVLGSILDRVPAAALATQIAPSLPTATLVGGLLTGTASAT